MNEIHSPAPPQRVATYDNPARMGVESIISKNQNGVESIIAKNQNGVDKVISKNQKRGRINNS